MTVERRIWTGTPSQIVNFGQFVLWGLLFWLVFPLFIIVWKWLDTRFTTYELTTERLRTRHGILTRHTDEIELYRVRDFRLIEPLFLRMFSLGNIVLETSDRSHPEITLRAIPNGEMLRDNLRTYVERCRSSKQVREIDFE
jgi:uncharacterized membrane protein YdbT with pleckstrin-like domain